MQRDRWRIIVALVRKELQGALASPGTYAGLAALFGLSSLFFTGLLDAFQEAQLAAQRVGWSQLPAELQRHRNLTDGVIVQLWGVLAIVLLFAAPLIAMRLFAEERRQRTLELLLASPASEGELVLGKFLSGWLQLLIPLAAALAFPIALEVFGAAEAGHALDWNTLALGFSGLVLLSAFAMALGVWVSVSARTELAAALGGFALLLPWMLLGEIAQSAPRAVRDIVARVALDLQLRPLFAGLLVWRAPLFLASGCVAFLLLARERLRRRAAL